MATVSLSPIGNGAQFFTVGGLPLNGGFLNTYQAGTTTPQATYTTSAGNVANPTSIPLGVDGRPPNEIWLVTSISYKFVLTDSAGVPIPNGTYDNISGAANTVDLSSATGAALVGSAAWYASTITGFDATSVPNGATIVFSGRDAVNDGGGGTFTYVASSSQAADGGMVFAPTGGGRLFRKGWTVFGFNGNVKTSWFGDVADWNGTTGTDCYTAIQGALDAVAAFTRGGVVQKEGRSKCNTPLRLVSGVSLISEGGKESTSIVKDSTTTKNVTIVASPLVSGMYAPGTLPSAMNAVLILDGTGGRYSGRVSGISFESTYSVPGNHETQKAEFGIVSVGSVSDSAIEDNYIKYCQYAMILPDIFASRVTGNRYTECLRGCGISGTSTPYMANYAVNCRTYGHYFRVLSYSMISSNACDSLNRNDYYPDRTLLAQAYVFDGCYAVNITANGQETTLGRNWVLLGLRNSSMKYNSSTNLGSDYSGTAEIAWIYSDDVNQSNEICDNFSYDYNTNGLIFGSANSAKHHNIYFVGQANVEDLEFDGNVVRASLSGSVAEAGWLNNVPTTWPNASNSNSLLTSNSPTLSCVTPGNLAVTYNAGTQCYIDRKGNFVDVFGTLDVNITYTTATGLLTINGLPTNNGVVLTHGWVSVDFGGTGLTKHLASFRINQGGDGGQFFDINYADVNITDIPTGTHLTIHYRARYKS